MTITELKVGVGKYEDGSGYRNELRWEPDNDKARWPGGILWIDGSIMCQAIDIPELIEALQYIHSQVSETTP